MLSDLDGQLAAPMLIGGRLVFFADHEGTGNIYSSALDGSDLRRHTDHDGFYARNPATDGERIVYHVAGDIWLLDSLDADARRASWTSSSARRPRARARQADHRRATTSATSTATRPARPAWSRCAAPCTG